jgi:predicted 2-oxoglutarate/Fe(II)-dependent dioxygenase YbiX
MNSIIQKKLFNKNECDYIKTLYEGKSFSRSKVSGYNNISAVTEHRTSSELMIESNHDLSNMLLPKFKEFGIKSLPEIFIMLKYDINQEFKKHTDSGVEYPNRYKTLIIQLSNETDYDGGELCIFQNGETIISSKEIGNTIMFNSSLEHCANKIIKGTRYSMVCWLSIDNFESKNKSLI